MIRRCSVSDTLHHFCLVGSKKIQQQEFTSHLGATITKSWEWQRLIAAEDTVFPKQPHTKPQNVAPAAKEEGVIRWGKSQLCMSQQLWHRRVGRRMDTTTPESPQKALSPRQGGSVPLWRLLLSGESSSRERSCLERTGEVLQKVFWGNVLLLKASTEISLC